jgi:transposase-like protein
MKNRKWDAKTKAMVVLQGLKGKPVVEICQEHQICHVVPPIKSRGI